MSTLTVTDPSEHTASGFEVVPQVLDRHDVGGIAERLQTNMLERSRAGARHVIHHPAVNQVAHDPRLLSIARRFLRADPFPFRATLFEKSARNNWLVVWHQDTALPLRDRRDVPGWGPWSVKAGIAYAHAPASALSRVIALRLHIDDSRADNGPLRVLPGTHTLGVLSDVEIGRLFERFDRSIVSFRPAASLLCVRFSCTHRPRPRPIIHVGFCTSSTQIPSE
jgi:hypothetical protein